MHGRTEVNWYLKALYCERIEQGSWMTTLRGHRADLVCSLVAILWRKNSSGDFFDRPWFYRPCSEGGEPIRISRAWGIYQVCSDIVER